MKKPFKHLTNLLRFNRGEKVPIMGPLKAEWEVVNHCNARCQTCLHWQRKADSRILSLSEGKTLIRQLAESGLLSLAFSGGEPLLRRDLSELIAYAKEVGLSTSLITNGLLVTERKARELVDSKLDTVYISIDAANPALNDELRGLRGYFELAMTAIDNLKSMRRNAGPDIIIKATVTNKNVSQLIPLAKLASTKGVEGFSFQLAQILKNAGFVFAPTLLLTKENRNLLIEQMNALTKDYKKVLAGSLEYYEALGRFLKRDESWSRYRPVAGFSYVQIDAWGNIFTSPAKINRLGSIRESDFEEIWYSKQANEVRARKELRTESTYLFDNIGSMGVYVSNLNLKRMVQFFRPIFNGGRHW